MNDFNFILVAPEITLLSLASLLLLVDVFFATEHRRLTYSLSLVAVAATFLVTAWQYTSGIQGVTFNGLFVVDDFEHVLKMFSYLTVGLALLYGRQYVEDRGMLRGGELYVLSLFALLGQMVMISASNMLSIYLGLELMSLSLYAMIAVRRDHTPAIEAAMKYFVLGALASGLLLYGISMVYGATGSLDIPTIAEKALRTNENSLVLIFGLVFIVAGLAFKLGVVPFHMWVPDVYQGAPTMVTLMVGGAPKLAAFAITLRVLAVGMFDFAQSWQQMLAILAVLSLVLGNLAAIMQSNVKRMLAFSTISHMGFVLLAMMSGVVANNPAMTGIAYGSAMFYMLTYVLSTLVSFGLLMLLSRKDFECETLDDLKGLNRRSPFYAALVLILMFSLAGIPPTVGFYAKLTILSTLVQANYIGLAVVAVLMSLIGAFYYLRVVKVVYFDEPVHTAAITSSFTMRTVLSINGLALLVLGIVPGPLMELCRQVIQSTFVFMS